MSWTIREAVEADAPALFRMIRRIDEEPGAFRLLPHERLQSPEEQAGQIRWFAHRSNSVLLLAEDPATGAAGYAALLGGDYEMDRASGVVVVEVDPDRRRRGVGRALLQTLEAWAWQHGLHRLELTLLEDNEPARLLYEQCGFVLEGRKRESRRIGGHYLNELIMAKLAP